MDPVQQFEDETSSEVSDSDVPDFSTVPLSEPLDSDEASNSENESHQAFDIALPIRHSYLGTDLEELSGCTLYDDGSIISLPLLIQQQGTMSLPGQILPLSLFHSATIELLREAIAKDRTFGLVSATEGNHHDQTKHRFVGTVGVTAETYEHRQIDNEHQGYGLKARCRQRFKVLDVTEHLDSTLKGRVLILPEVLLPALLPQCRGGTTCKIVSVVKRKVQNAAVTAWPAWVYEQYDENSLVKRMHNDLKDIGLTPPHKNVGSMEAVEMPEVGKETHRNPTTFKIPSEPVALSYWVAQNLPLVDAQRSYMLLINSSIQRLRWELSFIEKGASLCCQVCGEHLATISDTISMSVEGPQGTYVNPSGYVHETMTVRRVQNTTTVGQPSIEYTWFPGYKWTIADCRTCHSHIGWEFTSSTLLPSIFWGLSRRSVITLAQMERVHNCENNLPIL